MKFYPCFFLPWFFISFGYTSLYKICTLSVCEFYESGCSESHTVLMGMSKILPTFFTFLSESAFVTGDIHKNILGVSFMKTIALETILYVGA